MQNADDSARQLEPRWLDRWLKPRWRALLTWVVIAAVTGLVLGRWGNAAARSTDEFLRQYISPDLPFPLPAALQANPFLPSLAFFLYWFQPIALRLNLIRTLIWLIASTILGTAIPMVPFKFISFRLGDALFFGCLAGLPGLAVIGQRTRPWMTFPGGALAAAFIWGFEMGENEVIFAITGANLIYGAVMLYGTDPLPRRPAERQLGEDQR